MDFLKNEWPNKGKYPRMHTHTHIHSHSLLLLLPSLLFFFFFSIGYRLLSLLDIFWTSALHQSAVKKPTQHSNMCSPLTKGFWRLLPGTIHWRGEKPGLQVYRTKWVKEAGVGPVPSVVTWALFCFPLRNNISNRTCSNAACNCDI